MEVQLKTETFGKEHRKVLQSIDEISRIAENSAQYKTMFCEGTYQDTRGRNQKMCAILRRRP